MNPQSVLIAAISITASACTGLSIPSGVDPLPYFKLDKSSGHQVQSTELCRLYKRFKFVQEDCESADWKVIDLTEKNLKSKTRRHARNELQHTILALATTKCDAYKQILDSRARKKTQGSESLALLLSAGAAFAGSEQLTKALAASAGAANAFGELFEDEYTSQLEDARQGIEIARTRIFRQILEEQEESLKDYPLARAVNDALRYHSVCNMTEGIAEISRALSEELNEGGETSDDKEQNGEAR